MLQAAPTNLNPAAYTSLVSKSFHVWSDEHLFRNPAIASLDKLKAFVTQLTPSRALWMRRLYLDFTVSDCSHRGVFVKLMRALCSVLAKTQEGDYAGQSGRLGTLPQVYVMGYRVLNDILRSDDIWVRPCCIRSRD